MRNYSTVSRLLTPICRQRRLHYEIKMRNQLRQLQAIDDLIAEQGRARAQYQQCYQQHKAQHLLALQGTVNSIQTLLRMQAALHSLLDDIAQTEQKERVLNSEREQCQQQVNALKTAVARQDIKLEKLRYLRGEEYG